MQGPKIPIQNLEQIVDTYIIDSFEVGKFVILILVKQEWVEISQLLCTCQLSWKNALHDL
jgi:hypothetical protein